MSKIPKRVYSTKVAVPTYNFNQLYSHNHLNLPRLPIPKLEDTSKRYLESMQPLLTNESFKSHTKLVEDFARTKGPLLQKLLIEQDEANAAKGGYPYSYIEKIWDAGYLACRCSNPININPAVIITPGATKFTQAEIGSKFIYYFLSWIQKLKSGEMPPDNLGVDMSQFQYQVGTARLPHKEMDYLEFHPESKHVVVIHEGKYFKVNVITEDGKFVSAKALQSCFEDIVNNYNQESRYDIGLLTCDDRSVWAENREIVRALPVNKYSIDAIDSAIIIVCLDEASPTDPVDANRRVLLDPLNRWYDKHQVVIFKNGVWGFNVEHSYSDGLTWCRFICETWHAMNGTPSPYGPLPSYPEVNEKPKIKLLDWDRSPLVNDAITKAKNIYTKESNNVGLSSILYTGLTREKLKSMKLAPDGVIQTAYQLAHIRLYGFSPPTYESATTRAFFHGRTETIRSATNENRAFSLALLGKTANDDQLWGLLKAAVARHSAIGGECAKGQGVDRHLLALKVLAGEHPELSHPLFSDAEFARCRSWRLSTSNLSVPFFAYFAFGAVIPEGYGIGYGIKDEGVQMQISNFKDCPTTDNEKFANALVQSLDEIVALSKKVKL